MDLLNKKHQWILGGFEYLHADTPFETDPGSGGAEFMSDADGDGVLYPYAKLAYGASGTQTPVSTSNPLPAQLRNSSGTEIGTASNPVRTNPTGTTAQPVTDNGGTITIDTPQLPSAPGQNAAADSLSVVLASDHGALPLPTGAATAAKQDTGNTALAGIQTAVETLDNAIAGSEMQVDVVAALPAGANTIGAVNLAQYTPASGRLPVDGSGVTQPISAAALPLPSGAATEAKQPAFGTAGSASADVLTIQGRASMTPVQVSDAGGSLTTDFSGQSTPGSAVPSAGVAMTGSDGTNARHLRTDSNGRAQVDAVVTNAGTFAVQDSEKVADNAGFTDGTTKVQPAGFIFDEVAGTALTENDAAAARIDSKRAQVLVLEDATTRGQRQAVNSGGAAEVHGDAAHDAAVAGNPVLVGGYASDTPPSAVSGAGDAVRAWMHLNGAQAVVPKPHTSGGLSRYRAISAASTNGANIKSSPGQVYGLIFTNINAAVRYVKLYNLSSSPTVGTSTPFLTFAVPGNTAGAGMVVPIPMGIEFDTGIGIGITTGVADNDTGAVAANEIIVQVLYK